MSRYFPRAQFLDDACRSDITPWLKYREKQHPVLFSGVKAGDVGLHCKTYMDEKTDHIKFWIFGWLTCNSARVHRSVPRRGLECLWRCALCGPAKIYLRSLRAPGGLPRRADWKVCQRRDEWIMTDPAVNTFWAQICCVGIITGSGPRISPEGESGGWWGKRQPRRPWLHRKGGEGEGATIWGSPDAAWNLFPSSVRQAVNTSLPRRCSWPQPVTCPWSLKVTPMVPTSPPLPCSRLQSTPPALRPRLVIHWLLDRLPRCIDFCPTSFPFSPPSPQLPNLQQRSTGKIKNTVSLKLSKNPARGRYLGEGGGGWGKPEHRFKYLVIGFNPFAGLKSCCGWVGTLVQSPLAHTKLIIWSDGHLILQHWGWSGGDGAN